jgi:hypothetical protein
MNPQLLAFPLLHLALLGDGGWIVPVAVVAIIFYTIHRRNLMTHETLRAMIDKGIPLTPEVIASIKPRIAVSDRSRRDLRSGIILTAIGVGLLLFVGKPGYIVLFLGVAFLVLSAIDRPKDPELPPKTTYEPPP